MIVALVIVGSIILLVFGVKVIKVLLSIEKKSNATPPPEPIKEEEYTPTEQPAEPTNTEVKPDLVTDHADDDFFDYSSHIRNRKPKSHTPDFDLDGEFADDFEYTPSSPELNYTYRHTKPKPSENTLADNLLDMPEALKVLMLSDIFDKLF